MEFVIKGGRIIDPTHDLDFIGDIRVNSKGIIVEVGEQISIPSGARRFDASGLMVSPGWVDLHAHVYQHATSLGVNADEFCIKRGVTTVVDAGSAGALTLAGLRHFIAKSSKTRVLAFLHIACHGLAGAGCADGAEVCGESDHLSAIKVDLCQKAIEANKDLVVGVKVRLDKQITDGGRIEQEVFSRALKAARAAKVPIMVHHTNSSVPMTSANPEELSCPGSLQPGDIYTHTFHGHASSILEEGRILDSVVKKQLEGVIMDVGHGQGSFSWDVAEAAAKAQFWPDTISTDLHTGNANGPVFSLAHVMSKFLHLGMPMKQVLKSVTTKPAQALGKEADLGLIKVGHRAELTIFCIRDKTTVSSDAFGQLRHLQQHFEAKFVLQGTNLIRCSPYTCC